MRKLIFFILSIILLFSVAGIQAVQSQTTPVPFGAIGSSRNWNLIFNEPFNVLDQSKWTPSWFGATSNHPFTKPANSLERNCYNSNNVRVENGTLIIKVTPNSDSRCVTLQNTQANYQSGIIHTNGKFSFTRGYMEARIQLASGVENRSVWNQFWTMGQVWVDHGEIDVLEAYGTDQSCSYHYHHLGGVFGGNYTVPGSTNGFHIYAAFWENGRVTWFYDGVQIASTTDGVVNEPHFFVLALATIGTQVSFPSEMKVDRLSFWEEVISTPTVRVKTTPTASGTPRPLPTKSR